MQNESLNLHGRRKLRKAVIVCFVLTFSRCLSARSAAALLYFSGSNLIFLMLSGKRAMVLAYRQSKDHNFLQCLGSLLYLLTLRIPRGGGGRSRRPPKGLS